MTTTNGTTLVLGGTGKTGRRVAARLTARGLPLRIGSRRGATPFDWQQPATWAPAVRGVTAIYLTYVPDIGHPDAAETIRAFADVAVEAGVRRMVLLSGRGSEEALPAEQAIRDSGAEWTILRASWFCQNFDEGFLVEPVRAGVLALPAGDVVEPFVDAGDLADVAVAALTDDRHRGVTYELTGPRLLGFAAAAQEIGDAAGRPVRYRPITKEQFAAALTRDKPAGYATFLADLLTKELDGRNAHLTDGVQRALGREPTDFAVYARSAAAGGAWRSTSPA
jgi:uncharacterized protein YbjT (DUF2867 family)